MCNNAVETAPGVQIAAFPLAPLVDLAAEAREIKTNSDRSFFA